MIMKKENYIAPDILVEELCVELGFAASMGDVSNDFYDYEDFEWDNS